MSANNELLPYQSPFQCCVANPFSRYWQPEYQIAPVKGGG